MHNSAKIFRCDSCGTEFEKEDDLKRHVMKTHVNGKEVISKLHNQLISRLAKQTTRLYKDFFMLKQRKEKRK